MAHEDAPLETEALNIYYQRKGDGIFHPRHQVIHRSEEYAEEGFAILRKMQAQHFWYRGRHRFLLFALDRHIPDQAMGLHAIDLGGGVGGWLRDLERSRGGNRYERLALGDSSISALRHAAEVIPKQVQRFQVDLLNLKMKDQWDIAFLLDVIEHLPNDRLAIEQTKHALKPGGLLLITAPAFQQLWSYNDDMAHHLRRYQRRDFKRLASQTGFELVDTRYFMFFLSPLLLLSRLGRRPSHLTAVKLARLVEKQHEVPSPLLNKALTMVFAAESPLGNWLPFPWGTSLLGVFRKPLS